MRTRNEVKTCRTCSHRRGTLASGDCMRTGYIIVVQRRHPDRFCDANFSGWEPRAGILERIWQWLRGVKP